MKFTPEEMVDIHEVGNEEEELQGMRNLIRYFVETLKIDTRGRLKAVLREKEEVEETGHPYYGLL